jgi:hypothetical protein
MDAAHLNAGGIARARVAIDGDRHSFSDEKTNLLLQRASRCGTFLAVTCVYPPRPTTESLSPASDWSRPSAGVAKAFGNRSSVAPAGFGD